MKVQKANQTLAKLAQIGVVPVVRLHSEELGWIAVRALIDAGFPTVEVTMTVPGATEIIHTLSQQGDILLGAGTILELKQAEACIKAGADFLVSPCILPGLGALCQEAEVLCIMSGLTPNEVFSAWSQGSGAVKVFPCQSAGGPSHIRALKAVFPDIPLVPTGGVNLGNVDEYFRAGSIFVGAGSDLVKEDMLKQGLTQEFSNLALNYLANIRLARQGG